MAEHVDKLGLKQLQVESYQNVRGSLRSGDLLFCSGDYLVSRLIQRFTNSPWSHVGIIFRLEAIESDPIESMGHRRFLFLEPNLCDMNERIFHLPKPEGMTRTTKVVRKVAIPT